MRAVAKGHFRAFSLLLLVVTAAVPAAAWDTNDWEFLESIEQANLRFFREQKRGPYMLLNDTTDYDAWYTNTWCAYASVAGTGFELTSICLGHYRGWIPFSNAYEQVLQQLRLFNGMLSTNPLVGERVNGWTFHTYWIEDDGTNKAGTRFYMDDGLSLLDHSMFMAGCIFVSEYFKGTEAGRLAHKLYEETTWSWRPNGDYNFGYSENLLAIVECAEAPAFKKGVEAYNIWRDYCTPPWPRTLQFYFWQYPHAWVDFRFRNDAQRGDDHSIVALQSILYQRQRAIDLHNSDPAKYDMIGTNVWGWTAATSSGASNYPGGQYRQMAPWGLSLGGEWYDEEHASDSGSVTPMGLAGCMVYAGTETMAAMKYIMEEYYIKGWDPAKGERPAWSDRYGFINCMNKGKPWRYYSNPAVSNWFHPVNAGIDYGPNVLLVENYKLGTTWRYFMQNPYISAGMTTVGFGATQQVYTATFAGGTNQFGCGLGSWHNDATTVTVGYVDATLTNGYVGDKAARILADSNNEGAWIDVCHRDMRARAQLTFWVRGHTGAESIEVGLKDLFGNENKVLLADYAGGSTPTNWTEVKIPIEKFALTGSRTNDTWLGDVDLISFAFLNAGGGGLDVDYVHFGRDTIAPVMPTNSFGLAMVGDHARLRWDPTQCEHDVIGYHVQRRYNSTTGFDRVTSDLVPAYRGFFEDTSIVVAVDQEVRYAIEAFDNSEPQNSSLYSLEKVTWGGQLDVDWNNGRNPNVMGGANDGYWGAIMPQSFTFVWTNGLNGGGLWARRSCVTAAWSGHYIDMADGDVADYWALSFYVRGTNGGEQVLVGLKDNSESEFKVDLDYYVEGGSVGTNWRRAIVPLSEFTNVNLAALRNMSFTHEAPNDICLGAISFTKGQRALLVNDYFTEGEDYTRQQGTTTQDYKAAASGGEVLGWGWGADGGDYADYEFYVARAVTGTTLHVRYACDAGDGRSFDVRWDDVVRGTLACTNTGGWGDTSNQFNWTTTPLSMISTGRHKLTLYANGFDEPVNIDCWYLTGEGFYFRECEDFDAQVGSGGPEYLAGASGGEVLGSYWGGPAGSEAVYSNVDAGTHTGTWLHLWYAEGVSSGRLVDVFVDSVWRARLPCSGTPGWGNRVADFDRVSARIGPLGGGTHTLRFAVPAAGDGINLDCFYVGGEGPEGFGRDSDGDGLSDRQERPLFTLTGTVDTDGDGLSDGDELQYGAFGQVSDPTKADTDADGLDDREESVAGTDPWDEYSVFEFIGAARHTAAGIVVTWPSVSDRYYDLSKGGGLPAGQNVFTNLQIDIPATIPQNSYTDGVDSVGPLFYRINVHR